MNADRRAGAWIDALAAHRAAIESSGPRSPARAGRALLDLGIALCAAGVPVSLALMNVGFAIACCGALLARAPVARMPGFAVGCALSAWVGISVVAPLALHRHARPPSGIALAYGWLAVPVATIALDSARARAWALRASAIALVAATALAIAQFAVGWTPDDQTLWHLGRDGARHERASGFFGGGLTLGGAAALLLLAHVGAREARRQRVIAIAAAAIALLVSVSRMAWLAAAAGGCVRLFATGRRWTALALAAGVPALAALALALFHPATLRNSLRGDDGRLVIWRTSADLVAQRPWVGSGGNRAFRERYAQRWHERYGDGAGLAVVEPTVAHAHDSALSCAALYGAPAAALHIAWSIALLVAVWRARARSAGGAGAALAAWAAFTVAGLFNDAANQMEYVYAFAFAIGLGFVALARGERIASPGAAPIQ